MPLPVPTVHPRLLDASERFYPHTVTVQRAQITRSDDSGQPVKTWFNLFGHVNIPARVVSNGPGTGAGGWSGEIYAPNGTYDVDGRTMSLQGYFPDITETDQVVFNGREYEIQAVESDGESVTTRLRTRKVS